MSPSPVEAAPAERGKRPYVYLGETQALCDTCGAPVRAKVIQQDGMVWYAKRCPVHGAHRTAIADAAWWRKAQDFRRPADQPLQFHSRVDKGCPDDCGLCPDHEQHSCLALIEITDGCELSCPVCFNASSPQGRQVLPLAHIERMLDSLIAAEGQADLVQISGGEPTLHPRILDVIAAVKARPVRHVMLDTNGIRIAREDGFAEALAAFAPGFEVYLQFDSLRPEALKTLRGADLTAIRREALARLDALDLSTTLVCVVQEGVNDDEIAAIIHHALTHRCVRGVTFQPLQSAGRAVDGVRPRPLLLTDIVRRIGESGLFAAEDMVPLPCNPEPVAVGYALRSGETVVPVSGLFADPALIGDVPNAITLEAAPALRDQVNRLFSLSTAGEGAAETVRDLLCCLPQVRLPETITYRDLFRVSVVQFLDRHSFSVPAARRSCVHVVGPDLRIYPLDTYNLFHRAAARARAGL